MPSAMFDNSSESEYMSAMLMSWYMSGYYTGLYHGRKQAREEADIQEPSTSSACGDAPNKKKKSKRTRS